MDPSTPTRGALALLTTLATSGCWGVGPRLAVGPTVATKGGFGVEARLGFGLGLGSEQTAVGLDGSIGGGAARDGSVGQLTGGVGLGGRLVADSGPSGRLGFGFVGRRHFDEGDSTGYYGFGVETGLFGVVSGDSSDTYVDATIVHIPTGADSGYWLLGGGASLDWVWGPDASFGTLWLPLLLEYWFFSAM